MGVVLFQEKLGTPFSSPGRRISYTNFLCCCWFSGSYTKSSKTKPRSSWMHQSGQDRFGFLTFFAWPPNQPSVFHWHPVFSHRTWRMSFVALTWTCCSSRSTTRKTYLTFRNRKGFTTGVLTIICLLLINSEERRPFLSFIKIHIAAITAFHSPVQTFSVFAYSATLRFIKELLDLFPNVRHSTPTWDLKLVLNALMKPHFEPLATCSLLNLSMKTAFLVVITSAQKAGETVSFIWRVNHFHLCQR